MTHFVRNLGMLCLAGTTLVGCADQGLEADSTAPALESTATAQTAQMARLRFVHGAPTVAAVDVYVGASTTPQWTAVAFGTATPYAALVPDGLQLVLRTAGAAATDAPIYTSDVIVAQGGDQITSIAGGILGSTIATTAFRVLPYTEAFAAQPRGEALVRFVQDSHGITAAGFDVDADGTIEVPGVAAFTASDAAGVAIERDHDGVQLAIDTGTPTKQLTTFTISRAVLQQRGGIFLALVGVPTFVPSDARGLALLAVGPSSATLIRQNPTVYVMPTIPDSTGIDAFAIGRDFNVIPVAQNLGFGVLAPALQVAPSERGYHMIVSRAATGTDPLAGFPLAFESTGPLLAGERYLAVLSGFANASVADGARRSRVHLTIVRDGFDRTVAATGRLRAVAASPDAPSVDVGQFPPGTGTAFTSIAGLDALTYRNASAEAGTVLSAAPLNPAIRATGATDAVKFRFGALLATDRDFGIVAGAFTPVTGDIASRFIIVKTPGSGAWTAQTLSPLP